MYSELCWISAKIIHNLQLGQTTTAPETLQIHRTCSKLQQKISYSYLPTWLSNFEKSIRRILPHLQRSFSALEHHNYYLQAMLLMVSFKLETKLFYIDKSFAEISLENCRWTLLISHLRWIQNVKQTLKTNGVANNYLHYQ